MSDDHLNVDEESERLDELGQRIDKARDGLDEITGDDDKRRFGDPGEVGETDDAIAPPG